MSRVEPSRVKALKKAFASRLKARRLALGLTQEDVATRAHLQKSAISLYEKGIYMPYVPNFVDLCDALECPADELLGRVTK